MMDGQVTKREAPVLARTQWVWHRHYPDHVLLVGSHENFRAISKRILDDVGEHDVYKARGAFWLFNRWLAAMRSHEGYEEHKLYPYLESLYEVSLDHLREGHAAMHRLEAKVREAWLEGEENTVDYEALTLALVAFDAVLNEHLDAEEDAVVPMLLELSPAEFHRYVALPLSELLDA